MIAKRPGPMPDGGAGTLLEASVVLIAVVASIASALAFRKPRRAPAAAPAAAPPTNAAAGEPAREGQNAAPPMSGSR